MKGMRSEIELKLEPAARAVAGLVPTDDAMQPALRTLRDVIAELDAWDDRRARMRRAADMLRVIRMKLIESMPLTQTKFDRSCPGPGEGWPRCRNGFRAAWELPNGEAFCKRDAEIRRGSLIRAAISEAHGEALSFYVERDLTPEQVQAIADKLGVSLEAPVLA